MRVVLIVAMLGRRGRRAKTGRSAAIEEIASRFEPRDDEPALRCQVTPLKPALNFSLRQQSGYTVQISARPIFRLRAQLECGARVTPEGKPPVYLIDLFRYRQFPETKSDGQATGGFSWAKVLHGRFALSTTSAELAGNNGGSMPRELRAT